MDDFEPKVSLPPENPSLKGLSKLGSEKTEYKFDRPDRSMLETFPNPSPYPYVVRHESEEFTSLCPKTKQPDFATVQLEYVPGDKCVETKSLKLYLFAYRNVGCFMEGLCNIIADDLIILLQPKSLHLKMMFGSRGGIMTSVERRYMDPKEDLVGDLMDTLKSRFANVNKAEEAE